MKKYIVIILIFTLILISQCYSAIEDDVEIITVRAIILFNDIERDGETLIQHAEAEVLRGQYKGTRVEFMLPIIDGSRHNIQLEQNLKVFLHIAINEGSIEYIEFIDVARDFHIYILFLLFFIFLLIFGGYKGFRSFIALIITGLCVIKLFLPMVIRGYGFILSTVLVSLIIVITSFVLISGLTRKSLTAILGTVGGTVTSGILAIYFGNLIHLTGVNDEIAQLLLSYSNIDFRGLLYSGITIGVLGAAMDVSMTITSVIYEIKKTNPNVRMSALMLSGLAVKKKRR